MVKALQTKLYKGETVQGHAWVSGYSLLLPPCSIVGMATAVNFMHLLFAVDQFSL